MTNALTTTDKAMAPAEWQAMKEQAGILIQTGFLPPAIRTPEQALALALTGRELGIGMMEAIRGINIIQNKPSVSPQLMLALAIRTGQMENYSMKSDASGATVTIKRKGWEPHIAKFGPAEAKALGLDKKDNYMKQATVMFQWRALAQALRFTFPDAVSGLYTPDEMGADVKITEDGSMEFKVAKAEPDAPPMPKEKVPEPKYQDALLVDNAETEKKNARAQLFKLAKLSWGKEVYEESFRKYLRAKFGTEHTSELTQKQLDEARTDLKETAEAAQDAAHAG